MVQAAVSDGEFFERAKAGRGRDALSADCRARDKNLTPGLLYTADANHL
jgi:hypothetical protein|tara:strand:- start:278 stop:424 length:147 start_codon:yes stop_codon:yes gene_type:complete